MLGSPPPSPGWQPGQTYCREWRGQAQIDGQAREVHGTVCRQPDGSWRFQN
jgi:surface antigen